MDDSSYRLIFIWTRKTKSVIIAQKSILKLVKLQSLVELRNVVKYEKYSPVKLAFSSKVVHFSARNRGVQIRSDFGTKLFISDWIGLIKLFRSRIGLR
jgi:hypothetical protein